MTYAWIITKDHLWTRGKLPTYDNEAGVTGPRGIRMTKKQILKHPQKKVFKMYDDDDELYYTGQIAGDDFTGLEPLDDFGMPNAGCTGIKYKNETTGKWEYL